MDAERIRGIVERHFRVYEEREESLYGSVVARLYFLQFPQEEFDARYEAVRAAIAAEMEDDLLIFIRREGGEDILYVAPRPDLLPEKVHVNTILLVLTVLTTVTAGALYWHGYMKAGSDWSWKVMFAPDNLLWGGLTFALPLMLILAVHESAHFVAAKRHGLRASLPFFIPMPPPAFLFGTLGAFIRLRDPLPDRRALFDVGASGPIAGFALAVPVIILGGFLTQGAAVDIPDLDRPTIDVEGGFVVEDVDRGRFSFVWTAPDPGTYVVTVAAPDTDDWEVEAVAVMTVRASSDGGVGDDSAGGDGGAGADGGGASGATEEQRATFTRTLDAGEVERLTLAVPENTTRAALSFTWDDGLVEFGDPLLIHGIDWAFDTESYLTHPTFFAGWVGLLVTGINLLPAGQLDGGHVARAVLGERMHLAAYVSVGLLLWLSFQFSAWILMALFILLTGIRHPPPLNDRTELDMKRKAAAVVVLIVFALTFIPVPLHI